MKVVKFTFTGKQIKARGLHSRQQVFTEFFCAQTSCSGSFSLSPVLGVLNLHILTKNLGQNSRIVSCSVMLNAEERSKRTCPSPACRIITSITDVISVPYPGLNPESLKIEFLLVPFEAITFYRPNKGF